MSRETKDRWATTKDEMGVSDELFGMMLNGLGPLAMQATSRDKYFMRCGVAMGLRAGRDMALDELKAKP